MSEKKLLCGASQERLKTDYPGLRSGDACPICGLGVGFHRHQPAEQQQMVERPSMHDAVFILYCGDFIPLGTAFAVTSHSHSLLLTCAHCVCGKNDQTGQYELEKRPMFITSIIIQEDDGKRHTDGEPIFPVTRVTILDSDCDNAVLQIDGHSFKDTIDICPPEQMPSKDNGDKVEMYHIQLTLFPDEIPMISSESVDPVEIAQESDSRYWLRLNTLPGSSGGPLLNTRGEVIAMVISGYQPALQLFTVVPRIMGELVEHMEGGADHRIAESIEDTYSDLSDHSSTQLSTYYTQFVKINVHGMKEYVVNN